MRQIVNKLGLLKTVLLLTVFSVAVSLVVTMVAVFIADMVGRPLNGSALLLGYFLATLIPAIAAPIGSWGLVSLLLKIHHLEKEMRQLATYDSLTGLLNRRVFFENMNSLINLGRRQKTACSIFAIDLDHFKNVNDTYGHAAGDRVLEDFAKILKNTLRESDVIGRVGGEEFAVFLPNTNQSDAWKLSQRLHSTIRASGSAYDDITIKYTVSIGLASHLLTVDAINTEAFLKKADQALYLAKEAGRDQTFVKTT